MTRAELEAAALALGFSQVGVAAVGPSETGGYLREWLAAGRHGTMTWLEGHTELRDDPRNLLEGARSVVVVALDYGAPRETDPTRARIARYSLGRDYHKVIRGKLRRLATLVPGESRVCVDSAPLPEREWARRAGLGWFGKNTLLIDSRRGSWFFIGVLLCEWEFSSDAPALGGCGTCTQCVDACPTGAILHDGERWTVHSPLCLSYQTIEHRGPLTGELHGWTLGCDICQEVCPFNHPRESQPLRGRPATDPDLLARREWPSLVELAELSYEEWDVLTRGSAVRRTGWEGLRRNAHRNLTP